MDAAAGTKSTNIEDVVGPGKVFEAFWEGEETEPKVNMKVPVGGQKHKLREDIEHAWAATTGEVSYMLSVAINTNKATNTYIPRMKPDQGSP